MYLMNDEDRDPEEMYSLAWGIFLLFHTNFTIMIHTVSIWLTLSLALWRLIMIKFSTLAITMCTLSRCKVVLTLGFGRINKKHNVSLKLTCSCAHIADHTKPAVHTVRLTPGNE
jgi:hypothetical protein